MSVQEYTTKTWKVISADAGQQCGKLPRRGESKVPVAEVTIELEKIY